MVFFNDAERAYPDGSRAALRMTYTPLPVLAPIDTCVPSRLQKDLILTNVPASCSHALGLAGVCVLCSRAEASPRTCLSQVFTTKPILQLWCAVRDSLLHPTLHIDTC